MFAVSKRLSSSQLILIGFAAVIVTGGILLTLPFATQDGLGASFADGLFTSTSAVCVTGLIVKDTATYWSLFGQCIILALIQIGGMGVVTVTVALAILSGKKIGLKQRSTMQEAISAPQVGGIVRLTGFIIRTTIFIELIGAAIMFPVFGKEFGFLKGLWYSIFHSISAFCNAGFDLMGVREQFSSLTYFIGNPIINFAIMALIITGGIGFLTWDDILTKGTRFRRYRMQSKVILVTTAFLIVIPAIYFFFGEFSDMPAGERFWASLFQSVTPRTAGVNTADLTKLSEGGIFLMICLMVIGGSPGSTAGGMKNTTLAVMLSTAVSVFRRKSSTHFFGRRVDDSVIREAGTLLTMYLVLFMTGGFIISRVEGLPLLSCMYETASAIGTVGLTVGITPDLGMVSRGILIGLMYFGRVGGLTLIFAAMAPKRCATMRLPQEKLTVG